MDPTLSIVLAYRDRDLPRVRRCLESLGRQTASGFEVLFVDYGSRPGRAGEARGLVEGFHFATYLRSETRGHPWNRSQALNIGARQARGEYLMTSDVDMLFRRDFVAVVLDRVGPGKMLHSRAHLLPRGFRDWEAPERHTADLPRTGPSALGMCQVVARDVLHRLRGFDEYYRYWGIEDRDLHERLLATGLTEEWIDDRTDLFHQWHPPADVKTPGFLPAGLWGRMEFHFQEAKGQPVRNGEDWGKLLTRAERPALDFLDFEHRTLRARSDLTRLEGNPYDQRFLSRVLRTVWELPSGHAVAVSRSSLPYRSPAVDSLVRLMNAFLRRAGFRAEVAYRSNVVHGFIAELAEMEQATIADYYLDFPAGDGFDVLVRA